GADVRVRAAGGPAVPAAAGVADGLRAAAPARLHRRRADGGARTARPAGARRLQLRRPRRPSRPRLVPLTGGQPAARRGIGRLRSGGGRMTRALMIQGTASHVGKSVLAAAFGCWLRRRGLRVAPFKAQNMSLNSFVTLDGEEIARSQAAQAEALGL